MLIINKNHNEQTQEWLEIIRKFKRKGYKGIYPSPPDPRDYKIQEVLATPISLTLPKKVLLPRPPMILNQGNTPFCGGASGAGISKCHYNSLNKMPDKGFSMTFLYWMAKGYDGIPDLQGTYISAILKIMRKYGAAPESTMPFVESTIKHYIPSSAIKAAEEYQIEKYAGATSLQQIKMALNSQHYLIAGSLVTFESWKAMNGYLTLPKSNETLYGGHAFYIMGYDDNLNILICVNSWGNRWGKEGFFYMPYDYYYNAKIEGRRAFLEAWITQYPVEEKEEQEGNLIPDNVLPMTFLKRLLRVRTIQDLIDFIKEFNLNIRFNGSQQDFNKIIQKLRDECQRKSFIA